MTNNEATTNYPGSRWWKFDCHTHTPASEDAFRDTDFTDEDWLKAFMKAGIDCVAITDHNSAEGIPGLQKNYQRMKEAHADGFRELHLFPGVEISVQSGVHLLAIFDPGTTADEVRTVLARAEYEGTPGQCDGVTRKSFVEVVEIIHQKGGLAIPAHVDEKNGLFREYSGQTLRGILEAKQILAMELRDSAFTIHGLYQQCGTKWTHLRGSDTHKFEAPGVPQFPGSHFTWVKMGQPSLEGLRLALIDGSPLSALLPEDSAVDPNLHAENIIESFKVENARYAGRVKPLAVAFNPWLNTIIGGRGTGKSTVIELSRLALRRDKDLPQALREDFAQFNQVPRSRDDQGGLQEDTVIELVFRKQETRYKLQWDWNGNSAPLEVFEDGDWKASPGDIRERFPARIFSQKELFALSGESNALLRIIDQAPEVGYSEWEAQWQQAHNRYLAAMARLRELSDQLKQGERIRGNLADVKKKLEVFEGNAHADVLKRYQRTARQQRTVENFIADTRKNISELEQTLDETGPPDFDASLFQETEAEQEIGKKSDFIRSEFERTLKETFNLLKTLETHIETYEKDLRETPWQKDVTESRAAYERLAEKLKEQGITDPAEYGRLVQQRQKLEGQIESLKSLEKTIKDQQALIRDSLSKMETLRKEIAAKRNAFLKDTLRGNRIVKAKNLSFRCDPEEAERQLREILGCTGKPKPYQNDILSENQEQGLIADLHRNLPSEAEKAEEEIIKRLKVLREKLIDAAKEKEAEGIGGHFRNFLTKLPVETIDRLRAWYPSDQLEVSYSPKGDGTGFRSIHTGSPGQKTAAILALLLSYGTEPLILDQPEDDLDNHLIYELIVQQLRENKRKRQIIVVTHNPNIVVNGDAELVVGMDFDKGQCQVVESGSLQNQTIRNFICDVMEGGRTAFDERYRRIAE